MPILQESKTAVLSYSLDTTKRSADSHGIRMHSSEKRKINRTPLVQVTASSATPEDANKIETINVMHQGAYALTLLYDEMGRRALGIINNGKGLILPEEEQYTGHHLLTQVEAVTNHSIAVGDLSIAYSKGEPTEELAQNIKTTSQAIIKEALGGDPEKRDKSVDHLLGVDTFLRSEADSISLEVHDIRSPLTALKGKLQLVERRGHSLSGAIPDDVKNYIRQQWHKGETMRKHLAAVVPLSVYTPAQLMDELKEVVHHGSIGKDWQIRFPDKKDTEPAVLFNKHRLISVFENALGNAHKARRLLEERFLLTEFTATSDEKSVRALRFLDRLSSRTEEPHELEVAVGVATLGRRLKRLEGERARYLELIFRDNGIGNDHISGRSRWRRNFAVGDSNWSSSGVIDGTGIAMGKHREIVRELFGKTYADVFLRNRTDDKKGAELVLRLPEAPLY